MPAASPVGRGGNRPRASSQLPRRSGAPPRASPPQPGRREIVRREWTVPLSGVPLHSRSRVARSPGTPLPPPSSPAITPLSLAPPPPPFPVSLITPALGALRHERRPHRHRRAKSPRHASVARHVRSPQHAKLSGARLSLRVPSIALLHRGLPTRPRPTRRPGANAGRRRLCRERHWNRREEAPLAAC